MKWMIYRAGMWTEIAVKCTLHTSTRYWLMMQTYAFCVWWWWWCRCACAHAFTFIISAFRYPSPVFYGFIFAFAWASYCLIAYTLALRFAFAAKHEGSERGWRQRGRKDRCDKKNMAAFIVENGESNAHTILNCFCLINAFNTNTQERGKLSVDSLL